MLPEHQKYTKSRNEEVRKLSCSSIKGACSFSPPCNVSKTALEPVVCNLFRDAKNPASSLLLEALCGKSMVACGFFQTMA